MGVDGPENFVLTTTVWVVKILKLSVDGPEAVCRWLWILNDDYLTMGIQGLIIGIDGLIMGIDGLIIGIDSLFMGDGLMIRC